MDYYSDGEWAIPIRRIYNPTKLKFECKFSERRVSENYEYLGLRLGYISNGVYSKIILADATKSSDWVTCEYDISNVSYIDYIGLISNQSKISIRNLQVMGQKIQ